MTKTAGKPLIINREIKIIDSVTASFAGPPRFSLLRGGSGLGAILASAALRCVASIEKRWGPWIEKGRSGSESRVLFCFFTKSG